MEKVIKPIETEYNGYKFRSRLEARWAVFFDEMNIKYEYELEGFELPNKIRYLPDFYLPEMDVYVEVKPSFELMTERDIKKINEFSKSKRLLLIAGDPFNHALYLIHDKTGWNISGVMGTMGESIQKQFEYTLIYSDCAVEFGNNPFDTCEWTLVLRDIRSNYNNNAYKNAILTSRQARFEFKDKK